MSNNRTKKFVFFVIAAGVFLSTLDSSMVNIALPSIMAEFDAPLHKTEWVVMAYLLTISSTLLFWGHLSDRLGRGRFYGYGFLVFGAGSFCCGFSASLNGLIASRFLQALGAAMLMANGPAIIRETFPRDKLGRSLGLIGVAVSMGLMTGPVLGGYMVEYYSWRTLFFLSLPVCFVLGIASHFILPDCSKIKSPSAFDWQGTFLWVLLLFSLSIFLTRLSAPGYTWTMVLFSLLSIGAALIFFVMIEARAVDPVLPFILLKKKFFSIGLVSALLSFLILFSVLILMPFYLELVLLLSSSLVGLVMLSIPLAALIAAPLAGWLSDHIGARILSTVGLFFSTIGLLSLALLTPQASPVSVACRLVLFGIGQATFLSPNSASVLGRMGSANSGKAASLLATARNLGMMLGIALAGFLFSFFLEQISGAVDLNRHGPLFEDQFCQALRYTFLTLSLVGIAAVFLSWQRPAFQKRTDT